MKVRGQEVRQIIVEAAYSVQLVEIVTDKFSTWAVRGPDHFGRLQYWTQPDQESARSFYGKLVKIIEKEATK